MTRLYLVRYGLMNHIGRFASATGGPHERGELVVVGSSRGSEIGEVLAELPNLDVPAPAMRAITPEDLDRARRARGDRARRFDLCEAIFRDGLWPLDLIDVEPLLDENRTVIHYLGPHGLDATGLSQVVRDRCGLDVVLEPVGRDTPEEIEPQDDGEHDHGCGSCSSGGGCGSSGGCGSEGGGCSGCSVKDLVKGSRAASPSA